MKVFKKPLRQLSSLIIVTSAIMAQHSAADDRDIYISDTAATSSANHNILFVMDTSGSMGSVVAGVSPKGDYNPANDYGDSPDKIYVYDSNFNFTGQTIENSQNKCNAMINAFANSPNYPVYPDFALQWQPTFIIDGGQTCVPGASERVELNYPETFINSKNWKRIQEYTVEPGKQFSITISTNIDIRLEIDTDYYDQDNGYTSYCRIDVAAGETGTCTGITESFNDSLDVWVDSSSNSKPTVSYTGYIETPGDPTCTDNPDIVTDSPEWRGDFQSPGDALTILECKNDRNEHGINAASASKFITACPFNTACPFPMYAAASEDELSWGSVEYKHFVPGNYHDYYESPSYVDPATNLPERNPNTYCDSTSKIGEVFLETDTRNIYECFSRLSLMQSTVGRLVDSLLGSPVNVGLMRFNKNSGDDQGGTIVDAVQSVSTNTDFETKLNALTASGGTPLSEVLYEAYLYFKGAGMDNGFTCTDGDTCTDSAARSGNNYISPINDTCQKHNIVFLTDGAPSDDGDRDTEIKSAAGVDSCGTVGGSGKCLDEMAFALANNDLSTSVPTIQSVKTYTIGLEVDLPLLEETALKGNGSYFAANDAADLEIAFRSIIQSILTDATSFAAPAVSVNSFNELRNRDEIYYAVFEPSRTSKWPGNVKKYKLSSDGDLVDALGANAVDELTGFFDDDAQSIWSTGVDGKKVKVGGAASKLTNSRTVYASFSGDIPVQLTISNFSDIPLESISATNAAERTDFLNWLLGEDVYGQSETGDADTNNFMGDPLHSRPVVITYKGTAGQTPEEVLFFATNLGTLHAVDPADDEGGELWAHMPVQHQNNLRNYITAPFTNQHTYGLDGEMTVVTEEKTTSNSTNFELDSVRLYLGERRGGSHYYGYDVSNARIDADIGLELDDSYTTPFKRLWTITGGVHSILNSPAVNYIPEIATAGFTDLAQTWSKMEPAKLKSSAGSHDVLIFSGGYDPRHDDPTHSATNNESDYGNAIYIVDAITGILLYSIGNNSDDDDNNESTTSNRSDQHKKDLPIIDSIVATPRVIDVDGDGYTDMIFAVDILGHVWRIDLNQSQSLTSADYADGGMIFDLSSATSIASGTETLTEEQLLTYGPRRFYNSIDVSDSSTNSGSNHLNLVVGTGYRANPSLIETLNNRLYMIFDEYPKKRVLNGVPESDRYKYTSQTTEGVTAARAITSDDLSLTTSIDPESKITAPYGFYREFPLGEKVLQKALTFNSVTQFSTFQTSSVESGLCGGNLGSGGAYVIDINTGASVLASADEALSIDNYDGTVDEDGNAVDGNGDAVLDDSGQPIRFNSRGQRIVEFYELKRQGIPAETTLLLLPDLTICIGTECNIDSLEDALLNGLETGKAYRSFWLENK
jgi:type IV pilus assembly protein PilY1